MWECGGKPPCHMWTVLLKPNEDGESYTSCMIGFDLRCASDYSGARGTVVAASEVPNLVILARSIL